MVALGIDISKNDFHAFLLLEDGKTGKHSFPNSPRGHEQLLTWLKNRQVDYVHACMEATGGWSDELATVLHDSGHMVSIENAARIKAFGQSEGLRTKTDAVDAALIARYCRLQVPKPWSPPSLVERALQALVRRRESLINMRTQESNRSQAPRNTESIRRSISAHLTYLDTSIAAIEEEIEKHFNDNPDLRKRRDLLVSIPGIAKTTANAILAEMPGLEHFSDVKAVGAYAGLSPQHRQSGTWSGRSRICKTGNASLRKALFFPAIVAARSNPTLHSFAARLRERGKCKMVVATAVMRKLLVIAYGVLKSGRAFSAQPAS